MIWTLSDQLGWSPRAIACCRSRVVVIAVRPGELVGLGLGQELDPLVGDEVVLHPDLFAPAALTHMYV